MTGEVTKRVRREVILGSKRGMTKPPAERVPEGSEVSSDSDALPSASKTSVSDRVMAEVIFLNV
jgi:hypothetical protein